MASICQYFVESPFDVQATKGLTKALAYSGEKLFFNDNNVADIPSTGGPSSLSTIICPLILKEFFIVPKLGIMGRPAGGIDVLAQIDGYKIKLTKEEIYKIVKETNYCHFISDENFAPLDSILFHFRNNYKFKNVPSLVIASLLSKKLAVGVKKICLDIRYSTFGNFGKTIMEAKQLSQYLHEVANLLDIETSFQFTDNTKLIQPYIGRGESLLAIYEYIHDNVGMLLKKHITLDCLSMVQKIHPGRLPQTNLKNLITKNFIQNIEMQGGSYKSFINISEKTKALHHYEFNASQSGFLTIDIAGLRQLIVLIQQKYSEIYKIEYSDPCGVIFYKEQFNFVASNDLILTYRVPEEDLEIFDKNLNNIITIKKMLNE